MDNTHLKKMKQSRGEKISSALIKLSLLFLLILPLIIRIGLDFPEIGYALERCASHSGAFCGIRLVVRSFVGTAISGILLYGSSIAYLVCRRNSIHPTNKMISIIAILSLIVGSSLLVWLVYYFTILG